VDESFALFAPNYENSEIITVSANGVRLCGPSVDLTMQPK
jgi:hypothetical protein